MKRKYLFALLAFMFGLVHNKAHGRSNVQKCPRQCICDMRDDFRSAKCNYQNIVSVDVGVPSNVQIYDLKGNILNEVDNYAFRDLQYTSLVQLDLSHNLIFWIGIHAFAGLDKLKILNLSSNRLQSLSSDLFWYNKDLKSLDLSGNQFMRLGNEPFLIHSTLKVLNLSNSHIAFIPDIMFAELPGLEVLDLSDNFMIELQISVLAPVAHMKKLSLKDNPWHCDTDFKKLEEWINGRGIAYTKQCHNGLQMFEKMISLDEVPEVKKDVDLDELWNLDEIGNTTFDPINIDETNKTLSFLERFEDRFPSLWALIVGFQLGLILGVMVTYFWLANLCKCRKVAIGCTVPRTRRQLRRARNLEELETRTSLLWTTIINATNDTPPILRRQVSIPTNRGLYCRSSSWEILPSMDAADNTFRFSRTQTSLNAQRAETPPPPYHHCTRENV